MINPSFFRNFDWISLLLTLLLSSIGLLFIYSSTWQSYQPVSVFFKKQIIGIAIGLVIYLACSILDYRITSQIGYWLYYVLLGLLIFTIIKGSIGMGAKRWINLGFIKFQPSELAKLYFPMFLVHYFQHDDEYIQPHLRTFAFPISIMLLSFVLILKQPDLGTALIILFSGSCLLWYIGLPTRICIYTGIAIALCAPVGWKILKPYQQKRVLVFLGYGSSHKERYQIEQSKIAVGSGGVWGKGFMQGTQNTLSFLPESRTDFIFSVVCEELGFIGAFIILLLYALLYLRLLYVTSLIKDFYAQVLCLGLLIHLVLSTLINLGMILDLLPIVGIPLPFLSYGLTHTWVGFASIGCITQITMHKLSKEV